MRVAGIGCRAGAGTDALCEALERAGDGTGGQTGSRTGGRIDALATVAHKASAPALVALARRLGLPLVPVSPAHLAQQRTLTRSPRVEALFGTGSVAEAAALAAAGPGARLIGPRVHSADGMATAAIAEGTDR